VLLNESGGIIDDTVITKHSEDAYYVVTNAGRRDRDIAWFKSTVEKWNAGESVKVGPVELKVMEGWGLLALQGALFPMMNFHALFSTFVNFQDRNQQRICED